MKRLSISALTVLAMVGSALADVSSSSGDVTPPSKTVVHTPVMAGQPGLPDMLALIGRSPLYSAEFIRAAPVIAERCNMHVSKVEMVHAVESFDHLDILPAMVHHIDANREENHILVAWEKNMDVNKEGMCSLAAHLWGEDGIQFPGVMMTESH